MNVQGCSIIHSFFLGVSLCDEYDVDAETFIEQWMAFSLNKLNGAPPTLENLEALARKEFSKRTSNRNNATAKDASQSAGTGLTVYGAPVSAQYPFYTCLPRVLLHEYCRGKLNLQFMA